MLDVSCLACNAKFKIQKDKLPANQKVQIKCPKCKKPITIDTHFENVDKEKTKTTFSVDQNLIEFLGEGIDLALVCAGDSKFRDCMTDVLEGLNYRVRTTDSIEEAIGRLQVNRYNLIAVEDDFAGKSFLENPVLDFIKPLKMNQRRETIVILITELFKGSDTFMAYTHNVNLIINPSDIDSLEKIISTCLGSNERFYKIFSDCLKEIHGN